MHGKFELLSPGKASSHSTALPMPALCFLILRVLYFRVSILPACEAYPFTTVGNGILNVCIHLVRVVHTKWGQAQTSLSAQFKNWLGGVEKLSVTLHRQGIEPRALGFEIQLSNHWATPPPPSPVYYQSIHQYISPLITTSSWSYNLSINGIIFPRQDFVI